MLGQLGRATRWALCRKEEHSSPTSPRARRSQSPMRLAMPGDPRRPARPRLRGRGRAGAWHRPLPVRGDGRAGRLAPAWIRRCRMAVSGGAQRSRCQTARRLRCDWVARRGTVDLDRRPRDAQYAAVSPHRGAATTARGNSPAAFERRCIPPGLRCCSVEYTQYAPRASAQR